MAHANYTEPYDNPERGFENYDNQNSGKVWLLGDSLISGLSRYKDVWRNHLGHDQYVNKGIRGAHCSDVIEYVDSKPFSINETQTSVILCGTNDLEWDDAGTIVDNVFEIGKSLRRQNPGMKLVIHGLLPRDESQSDWKQRKIRRVNKWIHTDTLELAGYTFTTPDVNFIKPDGNLNNALFYHDRLHLNRPGYGLLAKTIAKAVKEYQN